MSGLKQFLNHQCPIMGSKYPFLSSSQVKSKVSELWQKMTTEERNQFKPLSARNKTPIKTPPKKTKQATMGDRSPTPQGTRHRVPHRRSSEESPIHPVALKSVSNVHYQSFDYDCLEDMDPAGSEGDVFPYECFHKKVVSKDYSRPIPVVQYKAPTVVEEVPTLLNNSILKTGRDKTPMRAKHGAVSFGENDERVVLKINPLSTSSGSESFSPPTNESPRHWIAEHVAVEGAQTDRPSREKGKGASNGRHALMISQKMPESSTWHSGEDLDYSSPINPTYTNDEDSDDDKQLQLMLLDGNRIASDFDDEDISRENADPEVDWAAGSPKKSGPSQGGPIQGGPKQGGPKQGGLSQGGSKQGGPKQGGPKQGGPKQGGPKQGGPRSGGRLLPTGRDLHGDNEQNGYRDLQLINPHVPLMADESGLTSSRDFKGLNSSTEKVKRVPKKKNGNVLRGEFSIQGPMDKYLKAPGKALVSETVQPAAQRPLVKPPPLPDVDPSETNASVHETQHQKESHASVQEGIFSEWRSATPVLGACMGGTNSLADDKTTPVMPQGLTEATMKQAVKPPKKRKRSECSSVELAKVAPGGDFNASPHAPKTDGSSGCPQLTYIETQRPTSARKSLTAAVGAKTTRQRSLKQNETKTSPSLCRTSPARRRESQRLRCHGKDELAGNTAVGNEYHQGRSKESGTPSEREGERPMPKIDADHGDCSVPQTAEWCRDGNRGNSSNEDHISSSGSMITEGVDIQKTYGNVKHAKNRNSGAFSGDDKWFKPIPSQRKRPATWGLLGDDDSEDCEGGDDLDVGDAGHTHAALSIPRLLAGGLRLGMDKMMFLEQEVEEEDLERGTTNSKDMTSLSVVDQTIRLMRQATSPVVTSLASPSAFSQASASSSSRLLSPTLSGISSLNGVSDEELDREGLGHVSNPSPAPAADHQPPTRLERVIAGLKAAAPHTPEAETRGPQPGDNHPEAGVTTAAQTRLRKRKVTPVSAAQSIVPSEVHLPDLVPQMTPARGSAHTPDTCSVSKRSPVAGPGGCRTSAATSPDFSLLDLFDDPSPPDRKASRKTSSKASSKASSKGSGKTSRRFISSQHRKQENNFHQLYTDDGFFC